MHQRPQRLSARGPSHLRNLLDEVNMTHFQDDAAERESMYTRKPCVVFVSAPREKPVRRAPGVFVITWQRQCIHLATRNQFVPSIITRRGMLIKCARVYWSSSEKGCLFQHELCKASFRTWIASATRIVFSPARESKCSWTGLLTPSVGKAFSYGKELIHQATNRRIFLNYLRRDMEGLVSTVIHERNTISRRFATFAQNVALRTFFLTLSNSRQKRALRLKFRGRQRRL